jgi:hypothetical protein
MRLERRPSLYGVVLALVATTGVAGAEPPPTTAVCLEAHAAGQRAERKGELKSARSSYAQCTAFECPTAVRHDCDEWRARVEQSLPSVIVRAKDPRKGSIAAKVRVDDALVPPARNGLALEVDPGSHRVRVEADGFQPVEQSIVVSVGEKERAVDVQLVPLASSSASSGASSGSPAPAQPKPSPWPYVLGAVGVVGVGVFVGVAVSARSRFDSLDGSCAPQCNPSDVDGVRRSYAIADVALAVGTAALVASGVWLVVRALSHDTTTTTARATAFAF